MTKYSSINIVYRLQKWMDSVPGQTFLNYAYSWGAAVVILGTLFKLTHMHGADLMLWLGMGTEVVVFFLSAFDRPFDKTTDGMELPTHLNKEGEDEPSAVPVQVEGSYAGTGGGGAIIIGGGGGAQGAPVEGGSGNVVAGGGTTIIGGGGVIGGFGGSSRPNGAYEPNEAGTYEPNGAEANETESSETTRTIEFSENTEGQAVHVPASIPPLTPDMTEATNAYVDELKKLTEVLERVSEQSRRLTTDSEEMENLNRTLTGICKVYEMQLKSASSQIGTIDEINEQTRHMAEQIKELNNIYARMIDAMSVRAGLNG